MSRQKVISFLSYSVILTLIASVLSSALPMVKPSFASHENISVDIDDVSYGQSDEVVISGTIEDVNADEDQVNITVEEPDGTDSDENVDLETNGDFSFVYEISNSADDGVFTVEVKYDGESVFSYFLVDEDTDPVIAETDDPSYDAGDDVQITGNVEDTVSSVDVVEITIKAPNGVTIVNSHDEDLDSQDDYEYTYGLDNDADHGRYAVIVTYDDNDEGSAIFEVNDASSGGSDQITAQLSKTLYKPGDTVVISGEINDVDPDEGQVDIVVKDPSNLEIQDELVDLQSDDSFDFDFDLDDNAKQGKYTVTISYISDDKVITFDVSTSSGSSTFSAKLDKTSYLAGDSMVISGTVPKILSDQTINIQVYRPDATPVLSSYAYVEPSSDRSYTATLSLPLTLKVAENYKVKINYSDDQSEVLFSITGQSSDTSGGVITVKTDSLKYNVGANVKISGKVAASAIVPGEKVLIQVFNPDEALSRTDPVDLASDGTFTYEFPLAGAYNSLSGDYQLIAVYDLKKAKSTFEVEGVAGAHDRYNLKVLNNTYTIEYDVSGGSIKSMFVKPSELKLVISIDAQEDGQLLLVLPRNVIDAVKNGTDIDFLVASTDIEAGIGGNLDVTESQVTDDNRTIVIDYKKGTDLIEISGTSVVPEFGPLSGIILATAIAIIIVGFARSQNRIGLFPHRN